MRVALVSDWYYPKIGGVASHMHHLAIKLKERGHEVAIVTNNRTTGKEEDLEKRGIELIKIPGIVSPLLEVNVTYGLKSSEELNEFLKDFDIIHSHHAFTPLALKAVKAGRAMRRATLLTTHSISFAHESKLWEALGFTISLFTDYLKYPHRIIAVSRAAKAFIEHFTDVPISIVPNGVDDKRFSPTKEKDKIKAKFGIKGNVVLYVSRMSYRKGPHVLLNAFSKIEDATLVIVGSGEMLPFLKAQAKFLGIEDRVVFMGYVPDDLLPEIFKMADIFVLPSVSSEAFGIVVLEAMASGVPVIATDVGGIPEVLKENEAGLLVPPGNELELRNAIQKLLNNEELRKWYGINGRKAVEEKYSWDKVVVEIEKVYEEIISNI
ncbi:MAG TPA: glycosyltransferase family 1 protein [Thermococcus litoralis]|uniref:Glycosyltransferase family 1 protein n=1 Tax=Thermococcus litoralis TaxID=2265 RepID=A0A7C0TZF2_THELI|nr:MAG: glycosyltransferase family 1 protein [Thermococci archaeon]HDD31793.1 glycosyltransferase family 1 protein [Thermococcus litoralis]